ncbi:restriction endonuclease subunit S, partial [Vibrio harveyi]
MSWPIVELGSVVSFVGGSQPPKSTFKFEPEDGYVRLLQIRDYKSDKNLTFIPESSTKKFCKKDDVMIGRYGPPVFQILRGLEGAYNVALMKAVPSEKVDKDYLYYFLKQDKLFRLIDGLSQRTAGQSGIDMDALKSYPMLLPPLDEQKRIAAILDKADAIRQKRKQAIELADEFLRSVFLDMFGDPVTNPKGWEVKPVGELVKCIVPGRDKPKSFTGEMPWITTNDLQHLGTTTNSDKGLGLSDEEISSVKARIIPKGSVLMTCVGDLGIISMAGKNLVMNQQLHAFLNSKYFEQEFLMFALSFQKQYMLKMASSTTVPYMNKTICN